MKKEPVPPKYIRIGIVQPVTRKCELEFNYNRSKGLITRAAEKKADIICTPECMLDGYAFNTDQFQTTPENYCVPESHPYIQGYQELAKKLGKYLIIGLSLLENANEKDKKYRNAALLVNPDGDIQGKYFKMHSTYQDLEATFYAHGTEFPVFPVQINEITAKIGIMICYDRQIPETARILALNGAEIIFNPAATGNFRHSWNTHLIQTRSYENKCFVVSINHAMPRINGRSFITDARGRVIYRCPPWEYVGIKKINIAPIQQDRTQLATRRPSLYQRLIEK
jgi:predicted amidohydrolase